MTDRRIGTLIGQYRVEALLGQGGMAAVYQAQDTRLNRSVAIKLMHNHLASQKSFQEAFLQEAAVIARLSHPNIVRVLNVERISDELVMAMELISGGNLRKYIKKMAEQETALPLTHAVDVIIQLANAINYAHQQGMTHRDLKPDNIVLQPFTSAKDLFPFRPVITDFGLARLSSSDEFAITGQPLGTYAYMSPEQALAEKIDGRTDTYSLGIMLYELSVGQLPYKPQTIAEAARFHGREPLPLPSKLLPDFPPRLEAVIVQALAKTPEERFATSGDFAKALLSLRGGLTKANPFDRTNIIDAKTEMRLNSPKPDLGDPFDGKTLDIAVPVAEKPIEVAPPAPSPVAQNPVQADTPRPALAAKSLPIAPEPIEEDPFKNDKTGVIPPMLSSPLPNMTDNKNESRPDRKAPSLFDSKTEQRVVSRSTLPPLSQVQAAKTMLGDDDAPIKPPPRPTAPVMPAASAPTDAANIAPDTFKSGDALLSVYDTTPPPDDDDPLNIPLPTEWRPPTNVATTIPTSSSGASSSAPAPKASVPVSNAQVDQLNTERQKLPLPPQVPRMLKVSKSAPPSSTGDYLVCMNVLRHTFVFALDKDRYTIGTGSDQDIQLEAQFLSRRHAIIERDGDGLVIIDNGSANGIWVNDEQLSRGVPYRWNNGDILRLGDYWMTVLKGDVTTAKPQFDPTEQQRNKDRKPNTVTVRKQVGTDVAIPINSTKPLGTSSANAGATQIAPPGGVLPPAPPTRPSAPMPTPAIAQNTPSRGFDAALDRTIMAVEASPQTLIEEEPSIAVSKDKGLEGRTIHNYRLDKFLGQGSIASVYAATDLRLNRPVAVKVLHESLASQGPFRKSFLDQARIASSLEHPNVVRVLFYDQTDEFVYLVMELIPGGSLRQYMRKQRREDRVMPYSQIISMGRQIAEGLHYVHQQGLVHQDIKPDNIVLRDATAANLQPVLTDFGLAQVSNNIGETFITDQPTVMFPYMSPEAVVGAKVDTRSDVYEVGTILYELTVGQVPFQPRSLGEAIRMHTREPIVRPTELRADVPRELERVIVRCLEKDPNSRYQTAIELARMLETISKNLERQEQEELAPQVEDKFKTAIMAAPIDAQMPYFTPQPVLDEQVGFDRIIIYSEKYPSNAIKIDRDVFTIGRGDDVNVKLEGQSVSRRHARIERFGSSYRLIDLGSRNGTWLGLNRLLPNVAEVWEPIRTARIGDYWLRVETNVQMSRQITRQSLSLTNLDDGEDLIPEGMELVPRGSYGGYAPALVLPAPIHDRVGMTVLTPYISVQPGQAVSVAIEIHNLSNLVDHFIIAVHGLPPGWVTIHTEPIYLLPNNRETASITLNPPLASTSSAGAHAFEISVTARAQNIKSVYQQCSLNVTPFYNFKIDVQPQRVRAGGRTEIEIFNTGNTYDTYTVQARDREQAIRFTADGRQFTVPPGQTDFISLRLAPRSRPLLGAQQYLPFEMIVNSQQPGVAPQSQTGELVVRPYLPGWILTFLLLAILLCGVISLLLYTTYTNIIVANATGTSVAATATAVYEAPVTATAFALQDLDADNLPNVKEAELGTDPLLPDTDIDGLDDGAEVRVWGTDPLNKDTDGDGFSDGDEVLKFGTNPLNVDSDGDTLPDNEDIVPGVPSTSTPTPFPTLFGTNGEICPGSPPTRLAVGIPGRVELGGVNNRLRDKPSVGEGQVTAQLAPGTEFQIIGGPTCDEVDFIRWWEVDVKGQKGWTAEGEGEEYYLAPLDGSGGGPAAESGGSASPEVVADTNNVLASLPPTDPNALDRARIGFQVADATNIDRWMNAVNLVASTQAQWVKVQINWAELQPNGSTDYGPAFQALITNLQAAKGRGLKTLVSITKAPNWSRLLAYSQAGPPDDPKTFGLFLTFLLQQASGSIDAIEIWNEPNLSNEWTGALPFDGSGYMSLFGAAYQAIRAVNKDVKIITAGLAPTVDSPTSVDDRKFLRQMLASGLNAYSDIVIGVHPYGWANAPDARCCVVVEGRGWNDDKRFYFLENLEVTKTILSDAGVKAPLWITEFGYATWAGLPGQPPEAWYAYLSPDEQAAYLFRAVQLSQSLGVETMFLWNLNFASDASIAVNSPFNAFSLVLRETENRPAFQGLVKS